MTTNRARLDELLRLVREDLATREVLAELHSLIAHDDRALHDYIRAMHFQASLNWLLEGETPGADAVRVEVRRMLRQRRRRASWVAALSVIAAGILVSFGLIQFYERSIHELSIAPVVGVLKVAGNADWSKDRGLVPGAVARIGHTLELRKGVAQFQFGQGALVNLDGPATLHIDAANQVTLHQGRLLADIPLPAVGFTVKTGTAEVVDLGTQFGVAVGADGTAEFHVLKGQVRAASGSLDSELLSTDQASRYATDGQSRTALPAQRQLFRNCLQLAAGIAVLSGRAQFTAQPESLFGPNGTIPQDMIFVFHEREQFRLPQDLPIVSSELRELTTLIDPIRTVLPAETLVDIYFVHLSGDRLPGGDCEITFTRPVLGFVVEPEALTATDALLGRPEFRYEPLGRDNSSRGALLPAPLRLETGDRLTISADRRTLTMHLSAGKPAYDQLRILVEAEAPTPVGNGR